MPYPALHKSILKQYKGNKSILLADEKNKYIENEANCVTKSLHLYFLLLVFFNFIICNVIPRPFPVESSAYITRSVHI